MPVSLGPRPRTFYIEQKRFQKYFCYDIDQNLVVKYFLLRTKGVLKRIQSRSKLSPSQSVEIMTSPSFTVPTFLHMFVQKMIT